MNIITYEWVEKAEGDYELAETALHSGRPREYDGVCFHAQQCAEKYLKAYLYDHSQKFPKIHDLDELVDLCLPYDSSFESQRRILAGLEHYSVEIRYPGLVAKAGDAQTAFSDLNSFIRAKLGLSNSL
jgi:HEPN domain-containing protein